MEKDDEIKTQALIDNTGQGIFTRLKEIENKREIYEKLWMWELLQNALDASEEERKTEVEIIKTEDFITFRHNGRSFRQEEVAHLIYHGSTKKEGDIGQFGTGFLTTHLLSRKIKVKGVREDNKTFAFDLDRNGLSFDEIITNMENTWEQYKKSLVDIIDSPNYAAEYTYPLININTNKVDTGIENLVKIAPYIFAFNDKLGSIRIIQPTDNTKFELEREIEKIDYTIKIVKEENSKESCIFHKLLIKKDDGVEIAVKIKNNDNSNSQLESLQGVPKIFLAFPLIGTQDLSFPAIVNSRKFEPTDNRDGIFLGEGDTDEINKNKELLESAKNLFIGFLSNPTFNCRENIHSLLNFNFPPDKEWLDSDWYKGLSKRCISELFKLDILKTENGNFIPLEDGFIPILDNLEKEEVEKFWDLSSLFLAYKDKIPAKELVYDWAKIIHNWRSIGVYCDKIEITPKIIAEEIELSNNVGNFKSELVEGTDVFEILNDFYNICLNENEQMLLDDNNILPDQNGNFSAKVELSADRKIDEKLKDISKNLGIDLRSQLLDLNVSESIQKSLSDKNQEEILIQIVTLIKKPEKEDNLYNQANIDLFSWLLDNDIFEYFEGYPLISSKEETFSLMGKNNKEQLLAPKEIWNEHAKNYSDLFPQDFIISSAYYEKNSQLEKWDKLKSEELILINPLYKEKEKLSQEDLESLLLNDEKLEEESEHEIVEYVEVSKIAFLETKDKGIIPTIRNSKDKCRKFLEFLFTYIVEEDNEWNSALEVICTCGVKHQIYPAIWFPPLKIKSWIPGRKNKSEIASVQSLASLLDGHANLLENCRQDMPSRLLNKLNISIGELMMRIAAKDENVKLELDKAMGSLFSTFMINPTQLSKIAELAENESDLFIEELEKRLHTREQIRKNQFVGATIETLLKTLLEKEGFKVERTGVGSDFLIEYDFITDDIETIFQVKKESKIYFYIEVKATSQDFAKMTLPQAKEARDKSDKYALCVVNLNLLDTDEENIEHAVQFVTDIGLKIQDKVTEAEHFKGQQEKIVIDDDIEIEIFDGPIRFKINKSIWNEGKTLEQFKEFILAQMNE